MKREIIPQPKGKSCVTILIPLGTKSSERALKLDDELLQKQLNELAKDACCEYAVRLNGETATAEIAFTHQGVITDQDEHDYEIKAINFMTEVDKLEFRKPEPECPNHNNADQVNAEKLAFIDSLIKDEEDIRKNFRGIDIMAPYKRMPFAETICRMTLDTWFELLKTYSVFHHDN